MAELISSDPNSPVKRRLGSTSRIYPTKLPDSLEETEVLEPKEDEEGLHENNFMKATPPDIELSNYRLEELRRHRAIWHWDQFVEFFIYHILYYIFFGPLTVLMLYKFTGINLMRNLRFWGMNQTVYLQVLLWIGSLSSGVTYILAMNDTIPVVQMAVMWFAVTVRCVVIAAKYATLSPERILLYKKYQLEQHHFNTDLMMQDWKDQGPKILFLEPLRAMKRHEFETSLFYFEFLVQPTEQTQDKISNINIEYYPEWMDTQDKSDKNRTGIDGFKVMGYLISEYQKDNPPQQWKFYCYVESIIIALTPLFLSINSMVKTPPGIFDIIRIILTGNTTLDTLLGTFIFFHIAIYDFNRKFFLLEQCLLIFKTKYSKTKLLPTINFNDPIQLQTWSMLRAIIFDYGQIYNIRTQGFFSLCFLGCIVLVFVFLALILNFLTLTTNQLILLCQLAAIFVIFTAYYLYCGAYLNSLYDDFRTTIEDIKSLYLDIQRMKEAYFIDNIQPLNFVHKRFVSIVKNSKHHENMDLMQRVQEHTDLIVEGLNDNIRLLEYDKRNNPFKLYGVVITFNLLKSVGVGLSTVFSYAIQQMLQQRSIKTR